MNKVRRLTKEKIERKIWGKIVHYTRSTRFYPYIYKSYWHYLLHKSSQYTDLSQCYYTARPNPGAGIGHQMANWIAGYWYAKEFYLKFAHIPFTGNGWEEFLGFGRDETAVSDLRKNGYKIRKLPLFNENDEDEIDLGKRIMQSYSHKRIIFLAEQDQFYKDLYTLIEDLKRKFYSAPARQQDKLIYSSDHFNIAIHVRRGDIMDDPNNPGLRKRYLSNDYFEKVLKQVLGHIKTSKTVHIYFFSQGKPEDYPEFFQFSNLHWCIDMGAKASFLHLVYADLLITSKSSFSYKPALLNNGIKVCPRNFWHGYPNAKDWILCENDGTFNTDQLKVLFSTIKF